MPTIRTKDGAKIFYKDWGTGQPVVFSHGWPLNSDAWDDQLFFFASNGYRAIALDRRGHGRSSQTWNGDDMNTYAGDLGERVRLVGAVTPGMLKTANNPDGVPISAFDQIRAGVIADRSQFWKDLSSSFYGANRPGSKVSQGVRDTFWLMGMQVGLAAAYECIKAFSESEFTEDLKKFDIPTLIIHGDDDQIVPITVGGLRAAKMIKNAVLKVYKGAPHGLMSTHKDEFNSDLLEFARQGAETL